MILFYIFHLYFTSGICNFGYMKNKISLEDNIRIIREARGYSQDYVASRLEITQQAYSNIEKIRKRLLLND